MLDPPPAPLPDTSSPLSHPASDRCAPHCLDPSDFGPHGRQREVIANVYEDRLNGILVANLVTSNLEDLTKFIVNDTHLVNPIVTKDVDLPDAPSVCEALSGPESDKWHRTILEELAAIKEAETWELIDPSPTIRNIVGC